MTHHNTLPARAGIGLRSVHYQQISEQWPTLNWVEAHSENFFADGGQPLRYLEAIQEHYPLSLHGVGLYIGSTAPLDSEHLRKLKRLIERFEPAQVSEHLCWGKTTSQYLNDLLPLPYTAEALDHVCARVSQVQEYLGRRILIENVSSYLQFAMSDIPEYDFLAALSQRSGCGILLDINNIYVNAFNHSIDADAYLHGIPVEAVAEFHLAGYDSSYGDILIDTHGTHVSDPVWALYRKALQRFGPVPTLIEWDTDVPELSVLMAEADKADQWLKECYDLVA